MQIHLLPLNQGIIYEAESFIEQIEIEEATRILTKKFPSNESIITRFIRLAALKGGIRK